MEQWAAESVEKRKVEDLIPYDRNPRIHSDSQIDNIISAIKEWGWTNPVLIDEDGNLIAGHGRLYAAQKMGIEEVPCVIAKGWTDNQKKAFVIADNKLAEGSSWDMGLYFNELKKLNDEGFDLSSIGIEDSLNFEDFTPIDNYSFTSNEVDESDMQRGSDNLNNTIDGYQSDKSDEYLDVICPKCHHEFKIDGA